jgi:hypothetical protein
MLKYSFPSNIFSKFNLGEATRSKVTRDSSVGIPADYGLDGRSVGSSSPGRVKNFLFVVQTGSGAQRASYRVGTGDSFLGGKAAGA